MPECTGPGAGRDITLSLVGDPAVGSVAGGADSLPAAAAPSLLPSPML